MDVVEVILSRSAAPPLLGRRKALRHIGPFREVSFVLSSLSSVKENRGRDRREVLLETIQAIPFEMVGLSRPLSVVFQPICSEGSTGNFTEDDDDCPTHSDSPYEFAVSLSPLLSPSKSCGPQRDNPQVRRAFWKRDR